MSRNIYHLKCSSVILHKSTNRKEVITMVRKIQKIKANGKKQEERNLFLRRKLCFCIGRCFNTHRPKLK